MQCGAGCDPVAAVVLAVLAVAPGRRSGGSVCWEPDRAFCSCLARVTPRTHPPNPPPSNPRTMYRLACRMSDVIRRIDSERLVVGRRLSPEGAKSVLREGALSVDLIDGVPVDNVKLPVVAKVRAVPLAGGSAATSPHAACWDGPCASAPCGRTAVRSLLRWPSHVVGPACWLEALSRGPGEGLPGRGHVGPPRRQTWAPPEMTSVTPASNAPPRTLPPHTHAPPHPPLATRPLLHGNLPFCLCRPKPP
jgi:hypothetical protein